MEAQVVLNGVGGVEDGPAGRDDQDEAVEGLRVEQTQIPVRSSAKKGKKEGPFSTSAANC